MKVTRLTNIGSGLARLLMEVQITTAEDFLSHDPAELYVKLEKRHPALHLAVLASFVGAHTKTPWYFIYHQIKKEYQETKRA